MKKKNAYMLINLKDKNIIYRYRNICTYSLEELMKDELVLSSADSFNDSHDISISFDINKITNNIIKDETSIINYSKILETSKKVKHETPEQIMSDASAKGHFKFCIHEICTNYIKNIQKYYLIGCFTSNPTNQVMWSHYSNNGKGFLIGYKLNEVKEIECENKDIKRCGFFDIQYSNNKYDASDEFENIIKESFKSINSNTIKSSSFDINFSIDDTTPIPFVNKNKSWEYEQEKRLVFRYIKSNGNEHKNIGKIVPACIILGENMEFPYKYLIVSICRKKSIPLYTVETSYLNDKYELSIRPLLPPEIENILNKFEDNINFDGLF